MSKIIPGFSNYKITTEGVVTDLWGTPVPQFDWGQYFHVTLTNDIGKKSSPSVHRLVAITFLGYPRNPRKYIVNHIDGNKHNNRLDNLEWTTYTGNILHAYQTGLRTECTPIEIMNIDTREVKEFYSLGSAASYLDASTSAIFYRVTKWAMKPYRGHFIKYKDDPTPWPEVNAKFVKSAADGTDFIIKNISTGIIYREISMSRFGRKIGRDSSSILYQLRRSVPVPVCGYLIRYTDDPIAKQWMVEQPDYKSYDDVALTVFNIPKGTYRQYQKVSDVAAEMNRTVTRIFIEADRLTPKPFLGTIIRYSNDANVEVWKTSGLPISLLV